MSWQTVKLGDVANFVRGITFKPTDVLDGIAGNSIGCMRTKNVQEQLDEVDVWYLPSDFLSNNKQLLQEGDLLVSTANSWNLVGKACWVPKLAYESTFGGFISVLRANDEHVNRRYLYYWFTSTKIQEKLRSFGNKTTNISNLNIKRACDLDIQLPPLAEQKRIAAILDKADEIRRKREQTIAKLDQLAQSIFVEMFGHPALNTKNLPLISLGEVGKWKSGGTPARSNKEYFIGDINWFSSGELEQMYISNSAEKISKSALETTSASLVKKGSLMLGMYDTAALKSSIADIDCSCNQAIAFAEITNPCIDTIYVYLAIQFGKDHFKRLQRGVRQKNLNLEMIRQIKIPLPAINKQLEFVEIFKNIQHLKETKSNSLFIRNQLFASLQHQAFTGNL
jgi:type I restriction enzyme S subunit